MLVVVTGARGYIGSSIAAALRAEGLDVVEWAGTSVSLCGNNTVSLDLTDEVQVSSLIANLQPNAVIHAAGRVSGTALELYRDNAAATAVLADAILRNAPQAILTSIGSAAEYGAIRTPSLITERSPCSPSGIYGHTKLAASTYLASTGSRGLLYNLVRPFNIVGARNSPHQVVGAFLKKVKAARARGRMHVVRMGPLGAVRDFIVLDDLVRLIKNLVIDQRVGEIVNACSGVGRPVRDVIEFLSKLADPPVEFVEEAACVPPDTAIGDPMRFLDLARLHNATQIEEILTMAWRDNTQ